MEIENPPQGSDPVPEEANLPTQHCFAGTYFTASRAQRIKLKNFNISPEALALFRPTIRVSEW